MRSHWVSNDVKYCPVLPSHRVPRSLHGVSASNTTSLTTKGLIADLRCALPQGPARAVSDKHAGQS
jgi:hypothetical protein